jgi:hypothetical protein
MREKGYTIENKFHKDVTALKPFSVGWKVQFHDHVFRQRIANICTTNELVFSVNYGRNLLEFIFRTMPRVDIISNFSSYIANETRRPLFDVLSGEAFAFSDEKEAMEVARKGREALEKFLQKEYEVYQRVGASTFGE